MTKYRANAYIQMANHTWSQGHAGIDRFDYVDYKLGSYVVEAWIFRDLVNNGKIGINAARSKAALKSMLADCGIEIEFLPDNFVKAISINKEKLHDKMQQLKEVGKCK